MFKYVKQLTSLVAMVAVLFTFTTETMAAKKSKTLKNTMKKGFVRCGVSQGLPGFSNADAAGNWTGVDVDVCRAVAAAVLGDANKVKFTPLSAKERFTALTSGEIDILSRNTTWTLSRDADLGVTFVGVNFYDGQGFMVRKDSGITSTSQFKNGISACTNIGTTTELNMRDFFNSKGISYEPVAFEKADEVVAAYDSGRCDTYTTDKSGLAAQRTKMTNPDDHIVLPETISKEPLGPVVRQGDAVWEDIVRWSLNVMIEAEEYGISSSNADMMKTSENPAVKRLVGTEGELGSYLGLDQDWSLRIIKQVGNYGESYKRNIADTGILPDRGPNNIWTQGGLLYTPPAR
ncbi:amino acid ABC transporter substrate-binding protein [Candidatus Pelagibacter sp.]|jgi:general L-amino acid transport system substrate-binding protein|uniref:amino acid ABC transporter substrate-binding protein n=1 Tax=Candidatus Pelagibacter sp. Uisw_106 TaxID=3230984 RepID=UPI00231C3327|nr:amino acid ABC transporter substrate-binding protein [Candidatus Pelagibacter sp.]MDA7778945.1 amino acid ABC transporter substrate-binding protein [Candidatus Pelagibacter sp.]MDA7802019.1 amino acid ABC transporter substrate-binding protein [Candidatus Pelagibacter sp.]MDA8846172.1 amino acid ABC transporter substrate-binding protein [Candidatus Pelagibacter sp.]MDA9083378.1 amino acid ABC transporter substrate-binding protein [Candidatus Pelagibacter sp.]